MALAEFRGAHIEFPFFPSTLMSITTLTGGNESNVMNSSGDKSAFILVCPKAGTLKQVHVVFPTVTTGDDIKFSFQDLNTSTGDPDGTADEYRVKTVGTGDAGNRIASGIISSDGTDGGTKRTVTAGQKIAVVVEFDSYVAGNMVLATGAKGESSQLGYPAVKDDQGSGWTESLQSNYPNIVLEYDDAIEPCVMCFPVDSYSNLTIGTGSTPDEVGSKFRLPFPVKVIGVAVNAYDPGDIEVQIENAGASVLAGPAKFHYEPDDTATTTKRTIFFDTSVDLAKDTDYYFVFKTTSATTGIVRYVDVTSGHLAAWPGGTNWPYVSRVDAGAWSEDATKKIPFGLIVSHLGDEAGGGGGSCSYGGLSNGSRVIPALGV